MEFFGASKHQDLIQTADCDNKPRTRGGMKAILIIFTSHWYIFIPFAIHVATACRTFWRVLLVYFSLPSILYYALFKRAKSSQDLDSGCLLTDFGVGVKEQVSFYVLLTLRVLESLFHAFNCRCHLGKQLLPNGCCFDGKLVRKRDPGYKVLVTWDVSRDGTFFCRLLLCNIGCQICTRKCWRFLSVLR